MPKQRIGPVWSAYLKRGVQREHRVTVEFYEDSPRLHLYHETRRNGRGKPEEWSVRESWEVSAAQGVQEVGVHD